MADDESKEGQEKESQAGGGEEKAGLSAKDIAAMTKQAMDSAGPREAAATPVPSVGSSAPAFVKYTAMLVHAVFLVCLVVLVWILLTRDKGVSGSLPMDVTVEYQRDIADGVILMSFRRYEQAEQRFRIAATKISQLSDRQQFSGFEFGHLRTAEGGALQLAENCRILAEADLNSTYVKGSLAVMVKAKQAMDRGKNALGEKKYDQALGEFAEAEKLYEEIRKRPRYKDSKIFEMASLEAVRYQGIASRQKANSEPILPPKAAPHEGTDEPGITSPGEAAEPAPEADAPATDH